MNEKTIKIRQEPSRRRTPRAMAGAGLLEVLVTLALTSTAMVGLLRMHASVTAFEHEQKMMTTAGFFEQDLNESLYLLRDVAAAEPTIAEHPRRDETFANWQNRVTNSDLSFAAAVQSSANKIQVEVAWSAHPTLTANERCTLNTSCLVLNLVP